MNNSIYLKRMKYLFKKCFEDDIVSLASQATYSLMLAFFPFLFLVLTVINNSIIESEYIFAVLKRVIPKETYNVIYNTLMEVMVRTPSGRGMLLTLIFAIWMSTLGFNAIITCLNKSYNEHEKRNFLTRLVISVISTVGLVFVIAVALFMLVFGQSLWNLLAKIIGIQDGLNMIWHIIRYTITFAFMILTVSYVYKFAPCKKLTFREVRPGALFTTMGWFVASFGFSYYVDTFATYSRFYGSLAAVVVFMVWLFLCSVILLFGGELNAALKLKDL